MSQLRYTDQELELISNTFADNEPLLYAIRRHFLQGKLKEGDKSELKKLTDDIFKVLRKTLLPEIDTESPLSQAVDMWSSINTKDQDPDFTYLHMKARKLMIDFLNQQFRQLEGEPERKDNIMLEHMVFSDDKTPEEAYVQMHARNNIVSHIDFQLQQLQVLAGQKAEDAETIKKRLAQNSNK